MPFSKKPVPSSSAPPTDPDPEAQGLAGMEGNARKAIDHAGRRLFVGTTRTNYLKEDHYRVRICCCQASSYWITVVTGGLCALLLLLLALFNINELLPFSKFAPWTLAACIVQALLMGVFLKQPMLLLPFRLVCAALRILCVVGIVYPTVGIFGYTIVTFIQDLRADPTNPDHKSTASNTELRDGLIVIMACVGIYAVLGVISTAATKCAAQLRDEQKKKAAALSDA